MTLRLTITKVYDPERKWWLNGLIDDLGTNATPEEIAEAIARRFVTQDSRITVAELIDATWSVEITPDTAAAD